MKQTVGFMFSFIAGSAIGWFLGYKLAKNKYEGLADREVESVKRAFEELRQKEVSEKADKNKGLNKNSPFEKIIQGDFNKPAPMAPIVDSDRKDYVDYSKPYRTESADNRIAGTPSKKSKKEVSTPTGPYTITPDEFKESHYESKTLLYFTDKVLTDDEYNIVQKPAGLIGSNALSQFGIYEDDAVYVRDDKLGIDYEVLLDERSFAKLAPKIKPKSRIGTDDD